MGNSLEETKAYVADLRAICKKYDFEGAEILDKYSDDQLSLIYNGIGPDTFPKWAIDILEYTNPYLAPVAMIHDVEWLESDGTKKSFKESNHRFRHNGNKIAKAAYPWYRLKRYYIMFNAKVMAEACQKFGWPIWVKHHENPGDPLKGGLLMMACGRL